ncbi:HET domain-containing protein [Fusarium keratoplasticum]|nr:HET domain-containing protein [Fusarium keratoplasticum]
MMNKEEPVHTVEWRCHKCRDIWWEWKKSVPNEQKGIITFNHHESFAALEESAAAGCSLCASFRASTIYHDSYPKDRNSGPIVLEVLKSSFSPHITFKIGKSEHYESFEFAKLQYGLLGGIKGRRLPAKRLAPGSLDYDLDHLVEKLIKPWIHDCTTGKGLHKDCDRRKREQGDTQSVPTRLIDVGHDQSSTVRLVVPAEDFPTEKPNYLALSYCWGLGNDPAKTTRDNIKDRRQAIDTAQLPKTIQDAIKLSQLVGVRYLWVDALCIIQSHEKDKYFEDWKAEAPKMGSYYSNAHCLIAASGASDSSEGLFAERVAQKYPAQACVISFDPESSEYMYFPCPSPNILDWLPREPLMTRGWCLQETTLAVRTLHWSSLGLFWECPGVSSASEFQPEGWEVWETGPEDMYRIFHLKAEKALGPTDRLIAVQGLGRRLAAMHDTEYFAGIFSSNLADGLLWAAYDEIKNREKLKHFPTWSWASCGSKAYFTGPLAYKYAKPSKSGIFPPVRDEMDFSDDSKRTLRLEAPLMTIDFGDETNQDDMKVTLEQGQYAVDLQFDTLDLTPSPLGKILILLLGCPESRDLPYKGLVLRPKGNMYERIGLVTLTLWGDAEPLDKCLDSWRKEVALI